MHHKVEKEKHNKQI